MRGYLWASVVFCAVVSAAVPLRRAVGSEPPLPPPPQLKPAITMQLDMDFYGGTAEIGPSWTFLHTPSAGSGVLVDAGTSSDAACAGAVRFAATSLSVFAQAGEGYGKPGAWGNAHASASMSDRLTIVPIDPALLGQAGQFDAMVRITGSGGVLLPPEWSDPRLFEARANYGVGVSAAGQSFAWSGNWAGRGAGWSEFTGEAFGDKKITVNFIYGEPFELDLSATIGSVIQPAQMLGGVASGFVTLDSVRWLGIDDVRDVRGQSIAGCPVLSESGTDWSQAAVPEPGMLALILPLAMIALRARARGRR